MTILLSIHAILLLVLAATQFKMHRDLLALEEMMRRRSSSRPVANPRPTQYGGCMSNTTTIGRGARGHFLPGNSGNGGGRPRLPDWFKSGAEDALKVLLACAIGKANDDDPPGAHDVATNASPKDRIHAAELVVNRVMGKAPEMITIDNASRVLDALIDTAKPVGPKEEP